jgi:hypothetical protein
MALGIPTSTSPSGSGRLRRPKVSFPKYCEAYFAMEGSTFEKSMPCWRTLKRVSQTSLCCLCFQSFWKSYAIRTTKVPVVPHLIQEVVPRDVKRRDAGAVRHDEAGVVAEDRRVSRVELPRLKISLPSVTSSSNEKVWPCAGRPFS